MTTTQLDTTTRAGGPNRAGEPAHPVDPTPAQTAADETAANLHVATMMKALGHPARVAILRLLARKACICGEIVDELPYAQSTVSQHLRVLKDAGWITGEIDGPRTCYMLDTAGIGELRSVLDPLLREWESATCCG